MRMEKDALVQSTIQPVTTLTEVELSRLTNLFSLLIQIDRRTRSKSHDQQTN